MYSLMVGSDHGDKDKKSKLFHSSNPHLHYHEHRISISVDLIKKTISDSHSHGDDHVWGHMYMYIPLQDKFSDAPFTNRKYKDYGYGRC